MQLCDRDILEAIVNGEIGFVGTNEDYPFLLEKQVQSGSIDLRLGDIIVRFKDRITSFDIKDAIDPKEHLDIKRYIDGQPIVIAPGEIIYSQIYEQMWIGDNYSARVEGRSRVARLGVSVHCTGGYINPGFCGAMPLQLINHNKFPITIYPYIDICQLVLFQLSGEPLVKYSERSRICNPYYDEKIAGPSVLRFDSKEHHNSQSIVEGRMTQLVEYYYKGLEKNRYSHQKYHFEDEQIGKIVIQNIQQQLGGFSQVRDLYSATQVGTQGPNSGQDATIMQTFSDSGIDYSVLLQELELLRNHLKSEDKDEEDSDILLGEVSKALKAIKENRKREAFQIIKGAGKKIYDIAKNIGCTIVTKIITNQMGL